MAKKIFSVNLISSFQGRGCHMHSAQFLELSNYAILSKEQSLNLKRQIACTLLQAVTLISGTQTGCRRQDSYMEQILFLPFVPEFSAEFSAPPEFCGGVMEKFFEHRPGVSLRPSEYEADILPLRHCFLMEMVLWHSLCSLLGFSGRFCSY